MSDPSFCYIAPTSLLDFTIVEGRKQQTHLILAHLVDCDPVYRDFYYQRSLLGDYIICDNSAYEMKSAWNPDKLIDIAKSAGAHTIVLPDYPFEPAQKTVDAADKYIPLFQDAGFGCFFVPQSKRGDQEDWIAAYKWAVMHPGINTIGLSILGIPNALPKIDPALARIVMMSILQDRGDTAIDTKHHFLGLNSNPGLEIPSLLRMGVLDTIDSSGPIWSAVLSHQYNSNTYTKKPMMPVDFSMHRPKNLETLQMIRDNISFTESLFTDYGPKVWYAEE